MTCVTCGTCFELFLFEQTRNKQYILDELKTRRIGNYVRLSKTTHQSDLSLSFFAAACIEMAIGAAGGLGEFVGAYASVRCIDSSRTARFRSFIMDGGTSSSVVQIGGGVLLAMALDSNPASVTSATV